MLPFLVQKRKQFRLVKRGCSVLDGSETVSLDLEKEARITRMSSKAAENTSEKTLYQAKLAPAGTTS